jgi:hypothetical protein
LFVSCNINRGRQDKNIGNAKRSTVIPAAWAARKTRNPAKTTDFWIPGSSHRPRFARTAGDAPE